MVVRDDWHRKVTSSIRDLSRLLREDADQQMVGWLCGTANGDNGRLSPSDVPLFRASPDIGQISDESGDEGQLRGSSRYDFCDNDLSEAGGSLAWQDGRADWPVTEENNGDYGIPPEWDSQPLEELLDALCPLRAGGLYDIGDPSYLRDLDCEKL